MTAGYGTWKKADWVAAAVADDGRAAVAYLPGAATIRVAMGRMRGEIAAAWVDPTSGNATPADGSPFPASGERSFTPPGKNAAGDGDWVLVLKAGH